MILTSKTRVNLVKRLSSTVVLFYGSRSIKPTDTDFAIGLSDVAGLIKQGITATDLIREGVIFLNGGANGVDIYSEWWAKRTFRYPNRVSTIRFPARWMELGKVAGHSRNAEMAEVADMAVGFWDGKSKGTEGMSRLLKKKNVPTVVYSL